ncbi:hypothetical protein [Streptomyces sp. NBC_01190]|uniref:hypothetical protein n=1 Tax=Streptomyces sp. NBC_01190 TaxID=2903767 RepID=UPI0038690CBE|nr:hypothetical protein OG519_16235 [Streptomyces sp. NBC_01190]
MNTRLIDALTHRGPGYEVVSESQAGQKRQARDRAWSALTHSGPGYELPTRDELDDIKEARQVAQNALKDALLENIEKFFYAAGHFNAIRNQPRGSLEEQKELAIKCFREFMEHSRDRLEPAISDLQTKMGPLDLRKRRQLRRLLNISQQLNKIVGDLLTALENTTTSGTVAIKYSSNLANRKVNRSLTSLHHVAP